MRQFVVGIPTLDRPNLLQQCVNSILASSVLPREICIIDNGNYVRNEWFANRSDLHIRVVTPPYNIGVAASWNLLHRLYAPSDLLICNDDVLFEPKTCEILRSVSADKWLVFSKIHRNYGGYKQFLATDRNIEWYAGGYSCFLIREKMFQLIGEFDELLWPGYWEDSDFGRRCQLAKAGPHIACVEAPFKHGVSHADVRSMADKINRDFVGPLAKWNRKRFGLKWGSDTPPPYSNRFAVPFNGQDIDELELFLNEALIKDKIYPECNRLSPILPRLRQVASTCRSIAEYGVGRGVATCALLAGRPESLVGYDDPIRMEAYKLMALRGNTNLEFKTDLDIHDDDRPIDLLAIGNDRYLTELNSRAGARCIIIYGVGVNVVSARALLKLGDDWKADEIIDVNGANDLIIFERRC